MPITATDIKLLQSERLADTPDGGGRITGQTIQDAQDNNLFDDVADIDRVTGKVSLRKGAVAVQTADTDKYLGARVMIAAIPADPATHGVLFAPVHPDDMRADAVTKLSSYLSPGATYSGLLFGSHIAGMSTIILLQRQGVRPPVVGDVLYLVSAEGTAAEKKQYVRLTTVATTERTFEDGQGEFKRVQVACGISAPLSSAFEGFEAVRQDSTVNYTGKTRVRETIVADAAEYYGAKPLAQAAALGDVAVQVGDVFAQLLPSSQVETALLSRDPTPAAETLIGAGRAVVFNGAYISGSPYRPHQFPGAVWPGSVQMPASGGTVTDSGGLLKLNGAAIGAIDYATGLCTFTGSFSSAYANASYQPAAKLPRAPQSVGIPITIASQSKTFSVFLEPAPLRGTVSVSYRSQGRWYALADDKAGGLSGAVSGIGAGTVDYVGGFASVSLAAMPDVGSAVVFQWAGATQETVWPVATLKAYQTIALPESALAIQPGSVTLAWNGWITSTDATNKGRLGGSYATGTIDYAKRTITFEPNDMPAMGAVLTITYSEGPKQEDSFTHPSRDGAGKLPVTASLGAILPGSLEVEWGTLTDVSVLNEYTRKQLIEMGVNVNALDTVTAAPAWRDPTQIARDDGNGNVALNGAVIGSVNYATGAVLFNPDVTISIPKPSYAPVVLGTDSTTSGGTTVTQVTRARLAFSGIQYIPAPSLYPNDESGYVKLRYRNGAAGSQQTHTTAWAPSLRVLKDVQAQLAPGSVALKHASGPYVDNGSGKMFWHSGTQWYQVGTIDYQTGKVLLTNSQFAGTNSIERTTCVSTVGEAVASQYLFRTDAAPIKPGSLSIRYAKSGGGPLVATAAADGTLSAAGLKGTVNYDTGTVSLDFGEYVTAAGQEAEPWYRADDVGSDGKIWRPQSIATSTLRYNATAYTYLPLGEDVLGLPSVQLPQDGRVVIYKPARVVVVHNTQSTAAQTVANGQTISTGRTQLAWARVFDANGVEATTGFTKDLGAGSVTFTNVAGLAQPVTVQSRIETEALCVEASIDGRITLNRPLAHAYPKDSTLVSSVMLGGTLQAGVRPGFSQQAWTNAWADEAQGSAILAKYDQTAHPIETTNAGAITQRWAVIFTSATEFRVVGETRGQIATGNTATQLAPVNPFTGAPLFVLKPAGWGSGWATGNVLRFNTTGAVLPFWLARTVGQSNPAAPGTDRITIEARGSVDV